MTAVTERDLSKGMDGDDVKRWQELLKEQGFDPGPANGRFRIKTEEATIKFQENHGLSPTGIVDEATRALIPPIKR